MTRPVTRLANLARHELKPADVKAAAVGDCGVGLGCYQAARREELPHAVEPPVEHAADELLQPRDDVGVHIAELAVVEHRL